MVLFSSMSCRQCPKDVDDLYHDLCRGHAYCARGYQYFARPCVICEEVWERARDFDEPEDAVRAFKALKYWIYGFRKNSRHRPKGQDHFYSQDERDAFQELNAMHANLQDISRMEPHVSKPKVSVRCSGSLCNICISEFIVGLLKVRLWQCLIALALFRLLKAGVRRVVERDVMPRNPHTILR